MSSLPAEAELVRDVFAGQSFPPGQGLFQSSAQTIAKLQSKVGIAQEFAQAIVDNPMYERFQLFLGKSGEIHTVEDTETST
jgi:hypothetical protein